MGRRVNDTEEPAWVSLRLNVSPQQPWQRCRPESAKDACSPQGMLGSYTSKPSLARRNILNHLQRPSKVLKVNHTLFRALFCGPPRGAVRGYPRGQVLRRLAGDGG